MVKENRNLITDWHDILTSLPQGNQQWYDNNAKQTYISCDHYSNFWKMHSLSFYLEKDNCFSYEGLKMISNKHFLLDIFYKIKYVWVIFELVFISRNLTATFRTTKMAISQFLHKLLFILNSVFYFSLSFSMWRRVGWHCG